LLISFNSQIKQTSVAFLLITLTVKSISAQLEIPEYSKDEIIIEHIGYSLSFNELHRQANWVAYELTENEALGNYPRRNNFRVDPEIPKKTALPTDLRGTDFDRGHLAPAGDMAWSKQAMRESFYMSNISPQYYSFNRGAWKKLEGLIRSWAIEYESLYIVTAGVLEDSLPQVSKQSSVSVPNEFYKVVLDYRGPEFKAIGFIMPNKKISSSLEKYVCTVDHVEAITGINFFHQLEDKIEHQLESNLDLSLWKWD